MFSTPLFESVFIDPSIEGLTQLYKRSGPIIIRLHAVRSAVRSESEPYPVGS